MSTPYELIIFDLGNVLINYDHRITCHKLSDISKHKHSTEEIYDFLFSQHGFARQYDAGKITSQEFFKTIIDRFGFSLTFEEFVPIWNNIFNENKVVSQLVAKVKNKYKVYLISNTNELHFNYLRRRFSVLNQFDKIFASYAVGLRKPHPGIFELALKTALVKGQKTIFIDDAPEHIEAAAKLGIKTILFTGSQNLKRELSVLGVVDNSLLTEGGR